MSYKIEFSETALAKLEALAQADAKKLRQIFVKVLSLRRTPFPQDSKKLENFSYQKLTGYRVDQGEYRIIYAVNEGSKKVLVGLILNRNEDYKELRGFK